MPETSLEILQSMKKKSNNEKKKLVPAKIFMGYSEPKPKKKVVKKNKKKRSRFLPH